MVEEKIRQNIFICCINTCCFFLFPPRTGERIFFKTYNYAGKIIPDFIPLVYFDIAVTVQGFSKND